MIDRYLPLLRAAMAAVLSVAAGGVQAQANLEQMTQRWLDDALARNMPTQSPLRMEVSVGALDERLRLAPSVALVDAERAALAWSRICRRARACGVAPAWVCDARRVRCAGMCFSRSPSRLTGLRGC